MFQIKSKAQQMTHQPKLMGALTNFFQYGYLVLTLYSMDIWDRWLCRTFTIESGL